MKKCLLFMTIAALSLFVLVGCGNADTAGTQARTDLTADHVRGLYSGMVRNDVEDLLGTSDKSLAEHESIEVYSLSDGTTALLRYRDDQLLGAYLRDKDNVETSIFNQNNAGMTGIKGTDSTIGGGADTNGSTNAVTGTDNTNGADMGTDNTNGAGTGTDNGIGGDTDTGDTRMTTDLDNAADSATEASSESR